MRFRRNLLLLFLLAAGMLAAEEFSVERMNAEFCLPLFGESADWSLSGLERRLNGVGVNIQHSSGRHSAFLRNREVLGARCAEIQIYTDPQDRDVTSIDLIFANKGDMAKRHAQGIVAAHRILFGKLRELFGPSRRDHIGPGTKKMRNSAELWQIPLADILLETEAREYLILHLRPAGIVGARKLVKIRDADFTANVRRNDFGDVWIDNLPMVDQGGKGYCVPATTERVLLYFGIKDAGMHKLADAANSDAKDGTTVSALLKAIKPIRRKAGLQYGESADLRMTWVARYIDDGIPIFWCLHSTRDYNKLRWENTRLRTGCSDPREWKKTLRRQKAVREHTGNNHICLIIGYNKQTEEIAVSNSWGENENKPSWVPLKAAQRVGQGVQFVIYP